MDWAKLKTFHAAADTGSLTAAAETLGVSQSAVSRQIAQLERELSVMLFHRHARGLRLTEQGSLLFNATQDMAHRVALAETMVSDSRDSPAGVLCVAAPVELGALVLAPRLGAFLADYPDIQVRLQLSDEEADLSAGDIHAALRMWRPEQSDLIQRRLISVEQGIYAARSYVAAHGAPETLEALAEHPLVVYTGATRTPMQQMSWLLREQGGALKPRLCIDTAMGVLKAIEAGVGIGSLPDYLARHVDSLVRVLPDVRGPAFDIYYVYPEELRGSRRIMAFGAFVNECARAWERETA